MLRFELTIAAVKVGPGETNKGIYVRIKRDGPGQGEVRLCTHCRIES
jgi:hypothetical protein